MIRTVRATAQAAAAVAFATLAFAQPALAAEAQPTMILAAGTEASPAAVAAEPKAVPAFLTPAPYAAAPAPLPVAPALPVEAEEEPTLAELVDEHDGVEPRDEQAECLASAIYFESQGEPLAGQLAVAEVIINRARSGRFAPTLCGVITQRSQFSFVRGGRIPSPPRGSAAWRTAVGVAHVALDDLADSPVSTALFFHARRVSPGWRLQRIAAVGNHVFYR